MKNLLFLSTLILLFGSSSPMQKEGPPKKRQKINPQKRTELISPNAKINLLILNAQKKQKLKKINYLTFEQAVAEFARILYAIKYRNPSYQSYLNAYCLFSGTTECTLNELPVINKELQQILSPVFNSNGYLAQLIGHIITSHTSQRAKNKAAQRQHLQSLVPISFVPHAIKQAVRANAINKVIIPERIINICKNNHVIVTANSKGQLKLWKPNGTFIKDLGVCSGVIDRIEIKQNVIIVVRRTTKTKRLVTLIDFKKELSYSIAAHEPLCIGQTTICFYHPKKNKLSVWDIKTVKLIRQDILLHHIHYKNPLNRDFIFFYDFQVKKIIIFDINQNRWIRIQRKSYTTSQATYNGHKLAINYQSDIEVWDQQSGAYNFFEDCFGHFNLKIVKENLLAIYRNKIIVYSLNHNIIDTFTTPFSLHHQLIAYQFNPQQIQIYDLKQNRNLSLIENSKEILAFKFIDQNLLITISYNNIKIWNCCTGRCLKCITMPKKINPSESKRFAFFSNSFVCMANNETLIYSVPSFQDALRNS